MYLHIYRQHPAKLTWVQSVDDGLACARSFSDLRIQQETEKSIAQL